MNNISLVGFKTALKMVNCSLLRNPLVPAIYFLILSRISFGANITSPNNIMNKVLNDSSTSTNLTMNLKPGIAICSSIVYGHDVNFHSCRNAWTKIPRTTDRIKYGAHNYRGPKDFIAPIRYLSDDGFCAIDITLSMKRDRTSLGWDVTTGLGLSERADELIDDCVKFLGQGGAMKDYSQNEEIVVVIRPYEPRVECELSPDGAPLLKACDNALQLVPSSGEVRKWGEQDYVPVGGGAAYYRLPKVYEDGKNGKINVEITA
ncbi:MAG: hypothetical protein Q9191_007594 [Dirinaria sp. TL-2023a]